MANNNGGQGDYWPSVHERVLSEIKLEIDPCESRRGMAGERLEPGEKLPCAEKIAV